jgi:hypothetical protein
MKLTTGILIVGMGLGTAWGQNLDVIENTRNTLQAVERKKEIDSNAALAASQGTPASSAPAATAAVSPASSQPKVRVAVPTHAAPASKLKAAASPMAKPTAKKGPVAHITAVKAPAKAKAKTKIVVAKPAAATQQVAVEDKKMPGDPKKDEGKPISMTGHRDPFISPVVNRSMLGSGCSTGKKCLAIDQIALKGVVKMEAGMIAVVVNALNKAYFLKENDPVFNGYVVKITGDSIIFKETLQDKLGKSFTREVTKKITTPAV